MGAKIWWHWLIYPTKLWDRFWKQKYTPHIPQAHFIRLDDYIQGSNIWNAAWRTLPLTQTHAFWEVGNGKNDMFSMEYWYQIPLLQIMDNLHPYQDHIQDLDLLKIVDLSLNVSLHPAWGS